MTMLHEKPIHGLIERLICCIQSQNLTVKFLISPYKFLKGDYTLYKCIRDSKIEPSCANKKNRVLSCVNVQLHQTQVSTGPNILAKCLIFLVYVYENRAI